MKMYEVKLKKFLEWKAKRKVRLNKRLGGIRGPINQRSKYWNLRNQVLNHYGRMCACCGEDHVEFLAIDHTNGGGNKHRRQDRKAQNITRWLVTNNFPPGFRIMCHNCNMAVRYGRVCPHKR